MAIENEIVRFIAEIDLDPQDAAKFKAAFGIIINCLANNPFRDNSEKFHTEFPFRWQKEGVLPTNQTNLPFRWHNGSYLPTEFGKIAIFIKKGKKYKKEKNVVK